MIISEKRFEVIQVLFSMSTSNRVDENQSVSEGTSRVYFKKKNSFGPASQWDYHYLVRLIIASFIFRINFNVFVAFDLSK